MKKIFLAVLFGFALLSIGATDVRPEKTDASAEQGARKKKTSPAPVKKEKLPGDIRREKAARCYGRIQIVSHSVCDFRVQITNGIADLKVQLVDSFANSPGKWQIVTDGIADYRVQIISDGVPDFTIQFVESFPGVR